MKRAKLNNSRISHTVNRLDRQKTDKPKSVTAKNFNVTFVVRGSKTKPNKECPINLKLNHGKYDRQQYGTGLYCKPANFDQSTGTIKNNPSGTMLLAAMKAKAYECYAELKLTSRPIDLGIIKAYSLDIELKGVPNVRECLQQYWDEIVEEKLKAGDLKKNSYNKQKSWHGKLLAFVLERHGLRPTLTAIVPADAQACLLWLRNKKNLSNDVAMRITAHFKAVLEFAVANEWIQRNPFMLFRKKMENKRQDSLTPNEVTAIQNAAFASDVLNQVRDIFLFQCYTGLAYKEASNLTTNHIHDVSGKLCIIMVREKVKNTTNQPFCVPLEIEALEILERFREHPLCIKKGVCLPIQSNQKVNAYLKQIQHIAGLKKRLTTHVARRTFATHFINEGMPDQSLLAMIGHSNIQMTMRHYAQITPETVVRDFQAIVNKRKSKKA